MHNSCWGIDIQAEQSVCFQPFGRVRPRFFETLTERRPDNGLFLFIWQSIGWSMSGVPIHLWAVSICEPLEHHTHTRHGYLFLLEGRSYKIAFAYRKIAEFLRLAGTIWLRQARRQLASISHTALHRRQRIVTLQIQISWCRRSTNSEVSSGVLRLLEERDWQEL